MKIRYSEERGHAEESWLKSKHSFSFASYQDNNWNNFGPIRVINEDWIAADSGFGMHPHKNMEIITIMLEGELTHKDNLGNEYVLKAGEVQVMTAGSGIYHSEWNASTEPAHLFQIWLKPSKLNLEPRHAYFTPEPEVINKVISDGKEGMKINAPVSIIRRRLTKGEKLNLGDRQNKFYIQVISGEYNVENSSLKNGDALLLEDETVDLKTISEGEILILKINRRTK